MALHVPVEVGRCFINKLVIAHGVEPALRLVPEPLPCASNDDASVCSGNEIVVISAVETKGVGVVEMCCVLLQWAVDVAADATDGSYASRVFGQNLTCVTVGGVDDL